METVKIDQLVPGGQGLGTLASGKKAFVWGALPDEVVNFRITKNTSSFCEGIAEEIIKSSGRRSNLRDPCYLATSPWQIMDFSFELEQKSALVAECFRQNQIDLAKVNPTITDGKDFFYRNKMEYSLYWDNDTNAISLAFHARGTHQKLPITQSSLERPEIFAEAQRIIKQLNLEHRSARDFQSILVRSDQQGKTSSALFENRKPHPEMTPLSDRLLGHEYSYSPNGFFQINLPVYELALQEIQKHIKTEKVLDLYAGVGTIGLSVARDRSLTLVEVNQAAFNELEKNCPPSATPVLAKSEEALDYIAPDTTVIVDPPRAGCDAKLIEKLIEVKPPIIIYLSCNPVTQARDLRPLMEAYQIELCQPFNFFPRTPHIEDLVVLSRTS